MKKFIAYLSRYIFSIVSAGLFLLLINNCASTKGQTKVSQFRFTYNDQVYRIRCISLENENKCYNEIMGKGFIALDLDQDRNVDHIKIGDIAIDEAQLIYDFGLNLLASENRLKEREDISKQYVYENDDYVFKIRSFRPENSNPFNELKIFDKQYESLPETGIMIDQNADGSLDDVLKGSLVINAFQKKYTDILDKGLKKAKLVKRDNMILVNENQPD